MHTQTKGTISNHSRKKNHSTNTPKSNTNETQNILSSLWLKVEHFRLTSSSLAEENNEVITPQIISVPMDHWRQGEEQHQAQVQSLQPEVQAAKYKSPNTASDLSRQHTLNARVQSFSECTSNQQHLCVSWPALQWEQVEESSVQRANLGVIKVTQQEH